jgi:hypothetical protein
MFDIFQVITFSISKIYYRLRKCYYFPEDNVRTLTENQGIFVVVEAMKTHANSPELLEAACAVILSLSMEGRLFYYKIMSNINSKSVDSIISISGIVI